MPLNNRRTHGEEQLMSTDALLSDFLPRRTGPNMGMASHETCLKDGDVSRRVTVDAGRTQLTKDINSVGSLS